MQLTNDRYLIRIGTRKFTERYYRDKTGWLKVSSRGRKFRMTAEQVLNHLLPTLAGIKPKLTLKVDYRPAPAPRASQPPKPLTTKTPTRKAKTASPRRPRPGR